MRYVSAAAVQLIPALRDADDAGQTLADCGVLLDLLRLNEFIEDARLRRIAERNGLGPDRFNVALATLRQARLLHDVPDGSIEVLPSDHPQVRRAALEAKTLEELAPLAADLNVEGRAGMNKSQLIEAIMLAQDAPRTPDAPVGPLTQTLEQRERIEGAP